MAGVNAAPSDLQLLVEDDVGELTRSMTRVEKRRLEAALQTLREEQPAMVTSE